MTINDRIREPHSVAVNSHGDRLYVSSPEQAVIMLLRPSDRLEPRSRWKEDPLAGVSGIHDFRDGAEARFNRPMGLALIDENRLLVADSGNNLIRSIDLGTRQVGTFAGDPLLTAGQTDGVGEAARFQAPSRLAAADGWLYVADQAGRALRLISPNGAVTTQGGDPAPTAAGAVDGPSHTARFRKPCGVAVGRDGLVFVADRGNHAIRRITSRGEVVTFAGELGTAGDQDGLGAEAGFRNPTELAMDSVGYLYVTEPAANRWRRIAPDGHVTTLGGPPPRLIAAGPMGTQCLAMVVPNASGSEDVHLHSTGHAPQVVVAGIRPAALAVDRLGHVLVLTEDPAKRKVTVRKYAPWADWAEVASISLGSGAQAGHAFGLPRIQGMATDDHCNLYLADKANGLVWKVSPDLDTAMALAGDPAHKPRRLAVTPEGNIIITSRHALLKVTVPPAPTTVPEEPKTRESAGTMEQQKREEEKRRRDQELMRQNQEQGDAWQLAEEARRLATKRNQEQKKGEEKPARERKRKIQDLAKARGITFEEAERWLDERDAGVANSAARHQARMKKAAENFKGDEFD